MLKVVFDLDDTLADSTARVKKYLYEPGGYGVIGRRIKNPDWESFFAECVNDEPIESTLNLAKLLYTSGCNIKIWTARCASVREQTELWLDKHFRVFAARDHTDLLMRPEGVRADDDELKKMWLDTHKAMGWVPDIVFEDRTRMVDMYRAEGITCYQVKEGDF